MNLIESTAWFLQNKGAEKLRIFEDFGLDFSFLKEKFEFHIDTLSRQASVTYFSEREDGATEFEITPEIVDSYVAVERGQFRSISQKEKNITVGAFGNKDEVVNCKDDYKDHYENIIYFTGGHRLDEESLKHSIIPAIACLYRYRYVK